jgi:DNA-binding CsgD family transcriptional regulator
VIALHIGRGTLAVRRGNFADAAEHLRIGHALTLGMQDGRMNGLVYDGLAELARLEGRLVDARQAVVDGLRVIANTGDDDMITRLCLTGMRIEAAIAQQRGAIPAAPDDDVTANVARLRGVLQRLTHGGTWFGRGTAAEASMLSAEAEAERIEGTAAAEVWETALEAWARIQSPYGQAFAQWRLAEALFGAGRRDDAARELRLAHEGAAALGAAPLADDIESLARRAHIGLAATGAEPEAPAESGLTPRELDVLRLVAAGSTNRQIGAALFISEKTASVHVSRILSKLGVTTRGQAGALAHLRGLAGEPQEMNPASPEG